MSQNIRSLFQKLSLYNQSNTLKCFSLSILGLFATTYGFVATLDSSKTLKEKSLKYLKLVEEYKKLAWGQKCLSHQKLSSTDFVAKHIETLDLLSDVKHRYEIAPQKGLPIDFHPHHNHIIHDCDSYPFKGLKKTTLSTSQPFLADEEDLKRLFCLTQGIAIFPYKVEECTPYFFFKEFHMKKKSLSTFEKAYQISYTLESLSL